jgi:hypothetical protein
VVVVEEEEQRHPGSEIAIYAVDRGVARLRPASTSFTALNSLISIFMLNRLFSRSIFMLNSLFSRK